MSKASKFIIELTLVASGIFLIVGCECGKRPKLSCQTTNDSQFRRISVQEYINKMKAGWVGQMVGVGWGAPTEFRYLGQIIPKEKMPNWKPDMVNQFNQDDIYVEMTFLRSLQLYGLDVSIEQAGLDFAQSLYPLWHANKAGRDNLREGIAPPDSGHPKFNKHADDIDYQIEADYAGLISPGMGNMTVALGEKFGRIMNYGDGLYGGQFVAAMYAEAFFENNIEKIIHTGLEAIPPKSQYAQTIRDVIKWHKQYPDQPQKTWQLIEDKYNLNPKYRRFTCTKENNFNIDAKINGAYIVMGMLYGNGDIDRTIIISTRCGQDSDCNPSSAAGILFTIIGFSDLPSRFTSELQTNIKFDHTPYDFTALIDVCEEIARKIVIHNGGRIEKDNNGQEFFVIPKTKPVPGPLEQCWEAAPFANSRFTETQLAQIAKGIDEQIQIETQKVASGWRLANYSLKKPPTLVKQHRLMPNRDNILVTLPSDENLPCMLTRQLDLSKTDKTSLRVVVGHRRKGDWTLIAKANGKKIHSQKISKETTSEFFLETNIDLTEYAGQAINIELIHRPGDSDINTALWDKIELLTKEG